MIPIGRQWPFLLSCYCHIEAAEEVSSAACHEQIARSRAHFAEYTARNGPNSVQCAGALFTGMDAQELLALSRKELQAKAKLAGVRANAKSSFIVQELLKKSAVL